MPAGRRLMVAVAAAALSLSTLSVALPAGAAPASSDREARPDASLDVRGMPTLAPPIALSARSGATSAKASARPLFAFWGGKYNRLDGFSFKSAERGSNTAVQLEAAWKTYRGVKPILPKVFVQRRIDGGKWKKVSGAKGKIGKDFVKATVPAYVVTAGVAAETIDYRLKSKKLTKGPRRARRSVTSDKFTVSYFNQAMFTGDQARFYAPIAQLCPNANIHIDTTDITEEHDAVFSWQHGITIDTAALAAYVNEPEVSKLGIAIHECAHMKQFYNWGGTNQTWKTLVKDSAEVFVADNNPDPAVPTVPMAEGWAPLEHAADCAKELISAERYRTYGGYCNQAEYAAAGLLWQGLKY